MQQIYTQKDVISTFFSYLMENIVNQIIKAVSNVFESYFTSDMDVVSSETKRILSNPGDRQKYMDAIERLQRGETHEEKIELSSGTIKLS